jgi:hypothetical protein
VSSGSSVARGGDDELPVVLARRCPVVERRVERRVERDQASRRVP